jgi:hypothetical protein
LKLVSIPRAGWPATGGDAETRRRDALHADVKSLSELLKIVSGLPPETWEPFMSVCGEAGYCYWNSEADSAHRAAIQVATEIFDLLQGGALLEALDAGDNLRAARILQDSVMGVGAFLGTTPASRALKGHLPPDLLRRVEQEASAAQASRQKLAEQARELVVQPESGFVPISKLVNKKHPKRKSINAIKRFIEQSGRVRTRPVPTKDGRRHLRRLLVHEGELKRELERAEKLAMQMPDVIRARAEEERRKGPGTD